MSHSINLTFEFQNSHQHRSMAYCVKIQTQNFHYFPVRVIVLKKNLFKLVIHCLYLHCIPQTTHEQKKSRPANLQASP